MLQRVQSNQLMKEFCISQSLVWSFSVCIYSPLRLQSECVSCPHALLFINNFFSQWDFYVSLIGQQGPIITFSLWREIFNQIAVSCGKKLCILFRNWYVQQFEAHSLQTHWLVRLSVCYTDWQSCLYQLLHKQYLLTYQEKWFEFLCRDPEFFQLTPVGLCLVLPFPSVCCPKSDWLRFL